MEEFPQLKNPHDNSIININNSSFSIGRSLSCDHIIQSLGVSRFHCIIKKNEDKWILFDRSTNGTLVNSKLYKFNENVELKNGDVIKLGPENLDFIFTQDLAQRPSKSQDSVENVQLEDIVDEFEKPFELEVQTTQPVPLEGQNQNLEMMENELTCSICSELFIKAVTLNCSHSFCKCCIEQWKRTKFNCPICRKHITSVAPTLVLDNFIDKFISTQSDEVKESRKVLVKQRQEVGDVAGSSSKHDSVVEIHSDTDDMEDSYLGSDYDSSDEDYDDDNDYYDATRRRAYYGGYGKCYSCNQTGHWANSCPFKRR